MPMSRRLFMLGGATAAAVATVGAWTAARFASFTPESMLVRVLTDIFGPDFAPRETYEAFAADHGWLFDQDGPDSWAAILFDQARIGAPVIYAADAFGLGIRDRLFNRYSVIATVFLQRTNFFVRDPAEPIVYTGLPDNPLFQCRNYIADFGFEPDRAKA